MHNVVYCIAGIITEWFLSTKDIPNMQMNTPAMISGSYDEALFWDNMSRGGGSSNDRRLHLIMTRFICCIAPALHNGTAELAKAGAQDSIMGNLWLLW